MKLILSLLSLPMKSTCFSKRVVQLVLLVTILFSAAPLRSQEPPPPPRQTTHRGEGAGYSTRDATVLSMMGWGVGLAVGIALLCGYLEQSTGHAH